LKQERTTDLATKVARLTEELRKANEYIDTLESQLSPATVVQEKRVRCLETGKVIYTSNSDANHGSRAGAKGMRMRAYQCDKCYGWHLTSSTNGK